MQLYTSIIYIYIFLRLFTLYSTTYVRLRKWNHHNTSSTNTSQSIEYHPHNPWNMFLNSRTFSVVCCELFFLATVNKFSHAFFIETPMSQQHDGSLVSTHGTKVLGSNGGAEGRTFSLFPPTIKTILHSIRAILRSVPTARWLHTADENKFHYDWMWQIFSFFIWVIDHQIR